MISVDYGICNQDYSENLACIIVIDSAIDTSQSSETVKGISCNKFTTIDYETCTCFSPSYYLRLQGKQTHFLDENLIPFNPTSGCKFQCESFPKPNYKNVKYCSAQGTVNNYPSNKNECPKISCKCHPSFCF
mgnify:CR=1 FL=1